MKKLLYLLLFVSLGAFGQNTNGTLQRQIASPNNVRGVFGAISDTIPVITGTATNGYILVYNSTKKKWDIVSSSTIVPSLSVGTVSPGGYANGLNYAAGEFRLGKVSATNPGVLTTGTDTIAGVKRFNNIIFAQGGVLSAADISVSASGNPSISVISTAGNATGRISRFNSGSTASLDFQTNGGNTWELSTLPTSSDFTIRNATGSIDAIRVNNSTNALTLSSLTTGSVYSSSGTLTNTAPTSGTIGYWSRTGTTLTTATANDNVNIGTGDYTGGDANLSQTLKLLTTFTSGLGAGDIGLDNGGLRGGVVRARNAADNAYLNLIEANASDQVSIGRGGVPILLGGALTGTSATFSGAVNIGNASGNSNLNLNRLASTSELAIRFKTNSTDDFYIGTGVTGNDSDFAIYNYGTSSTVFKVARSTGFVTATTPSANDNSTRLATTAYVDNAAYSGTYTPTPSNEVNIASLTVNQFMYSRVGNVVTGSGDINIDPTAASQVQVRLTLPIASNFTSTVDANGGLFGYEQNGSDLKADPTNDAFTLSYEATATNLRTMKVWFQYIVK